MQLQQTFIYDFVHKAQLYRCTLCSFPFALPNVTLEHGLKIHWTNGNDLATAFLLVHDDFAVTVAVNELHYFVFFLISHTTHAVTMMNFNIVDFACFFFFIFFIFLLLSTANHSSCVLAFSFNLVGFVSAVVL